jgi:Pyrimidine dimer DNA glycosylase
MRLWTVHPRYLDARGLVALWREALLARAVLRGRTRGYRHHPQLERFRAHRRPLAAIDAYLHGVLEEAAARGYAFRRARVGVRRRRIVLRATRGQLAHEWHHLLRKLKQRSPALHARWRRSAPRPHPLFRVVPGNVAGWERARDRRIIATRRKTKTR